MATRAIAVGDAVYARYSSELQNPRSCDDQITELRQALERRGGKFDQRLVFSDSEVSGGIWERDGLQALLMAVESGRVRRIFVEDLSRLSRDKEDAARIEKLLAYREVSIVTLDGMVYDGSTGSALAFTFQSAGAAQYLKDLGAKTRRGLRGSHRDGKSTGGRCFGFEVEALKLKVNEAEARVVRRIFSLYVEGFGYAAIAERLNADGVPPPRSRRRAGAGWMHSGIREMLRNPKYVGQFSFGRRKWQRHPTTRKRVARLNDEVDVLREERPDLAIVDRATWDAVQLRLSEHAQDYKARAIPHQKTSYLLTGLLKCACCGALMQICGGSPHRYYRCVSNRKRGVCTNRLSVRETLTRQRVLEAISSAIASPEAVAHIRHRLAERLGSFSRDIAADLEARVARVKRVEERVRGLIVMQAEGDRSPMVAQMRADFEAQAQTERTAVEELRSQAEAPIRLPPVDLITERVLALRADVEGGRAALRRYLKGGEITLTPESFEGRETYVARAEFLPLVFLTENATTPSEGYQGGRCPRRVARGRNAGCIPRYHWGLRGGSSPEVLAFSFSF
jgi:site-specific DNA recombinase